MPAPRGMKPTVNNPAQVLKKNFKPCIQKI